MLNLCLLLFRATLPLTGYLVSSPKINFYNARKENIVSEGQSTLEAKQIQVGYFT